MVSRVKKKAREALILVSHGSLTQRPNPMIPVICRGLRRRLLYRHVKVAYLGPKAPSLEAQVARLRTIGIRRVVILPYFLHDGFHVSGEIPRLIRKFRRRWPNLTIRRTAFLGSHPALTDVCRDLTQKI